MSPERKRFFRVLATCLIAVSPIKCPLVSFICLSLSKSSIIKDKKKNTCLLRYNAVTNLCHEETKQKIKETCIERYNVDNPMKSNEVKEKLNKSCIDKYDKIRYVLTDEYIKKRKELNKPRWPIKLFSKNFGFLEKQPRKAEK